MSPLWSIWTRPVIPSNDTFLIAATIKAPFESSSRCSPAANAKSMTASYRFAAYEFALSWVRRCCTHTHTHTHVRVLQRHYSCTFTREMPARTPLFFPGRTLKRTHACVQARMHSCARTRAHAHARTNTRMRLLFTLTRTHTHALRARTHAHVHKKTPARSRQRMRP